MRYHSVSSAVERDYLVHPYRLTLRTANSYLLAFVPAYNDVRTFAVDRIKSVSLEKQTFAPHKDRTDDEAFGNSLGVYTGADGAVELEFEARMAPYVRARVWHSSQQSRRPRAAASTFRCRCVTTGRCEAGFWVGARWRACWSRRRLLMNPVRASISQQTSPAARSRGAWGCQG